MHYYDVDCKIARRIECKRVLCGTQKMCADGESLAKQLFDNKKNVFDAFVLRANREHFNFLFAILLVRYAVHTAIYNLEIMDGTAAKA